MQLLFRFCRRFLIAMGYSTYVAIALPAIGYDSLCTYALLGAPIVVFVDIANSFLGKGHEITLSQAGMVFFMFLPVVSTMIGFCMLWIVGRMKAIKEGWLPCLISGAVIGFVAYFTNRYDNLVVLTGVLCGISVIIAMIVFLKLSGKKGHRQKPAHCRRACIRKRISAVARTFSPGLFLSSLSLRLTYQRICLIIFYRTLKLPITGITADATRPLDTRALWQAYTWIFVSINRIDSAYTSKRKRS